MSDFTILTKKQQKVLARFIKFMQIRLINIKDLVDQGQMCGKFVPRRCFGFMNEYGCSACSPFICKQCGSATASLEMRFCGGYCSWEYYGKPKCDTWSM
jgi:hypothetical protein